MAHPDYAYVVGVLGAVIIITGWASVLRQPPPPASLSLLYTVGSLLLTVYAVMRDDPVFTLLNALATLLALANILRVRSKRKLV